MEEMGELLLMAEQLKMTTDLYSPGGKLHRPKKVAAKVPTVKQIFRNAAHLERPTEPVSNSANPCFCGTSNIDLFEKVRYQGWYGEGLGRCKNK